MEIKYSSGKLRGKIREVCGTEKEFAKVLKISATALSLKLNNKGDWSRSEMEEIMRILSIKRKEIIDYFFEKSGSIIFEGVKK
jgi:hypothetical protein